MVQNPKDEKNGGIEELETPLQELTDSEAAQVEGGGYVGTSGGGVWKTTNGGQTTGMQIKLEDRLITQF